MPKKSYALEPGGPKRLQVSWKSFFRDTTITVDGVVVGSIPDQPTLREGQEFRLMDGSILKVQLVSNLMGTEMQVLRNGVPLPGTATNPETRVKTAAGIIYFIAASNLLLGLLSVVVRSDVFAQLGFDWTTLVLGVVFLILGIFTSRRSKVALIIAIVLFSLASLWTIIVTLMAGNTSIIFNALLRITLIIVMCQGVGAISAMNKPTLPPSVPPSVPPAM